ncbi:hypothetical protein BP5796_02963 [Coleophoma crateriformis]|uniref:DUF21-domain-containing protein n=1 Tax=Coleophoma crateriformis TaxID=565419 RepID=A0A3D8SLQ3_9HELO|nr:hypothetical protein BP5796_02963 [Coleophoma crateriformis]
MSPHPSIALHGSHQSATAAMKVLTSHAVEKIAQRGSAAAVTTVVSHDFLIHGLNAALSVTLVLMGGMFAGLTLAFMGQDLTTLRITSLSGTILERRHASKVLNVLSRGRHWVLVSLLLGNVIVNETLPIVLDSDVKGGWFAVLASSGLIVIFGEIIPQSICAKYGLGIGAWSSRYVLWVMYILSPVAYPIAILLDRLLGDTHGQIFNRNGLKALILLHERLSFSATERLNREEVTIITSTLDANDRPISSLMTPLSKLYALPIDTPLNELTRYNILNSRFAHIPIHMAGHTRSFLGLLAVKSLIALPPQSEHGEITIADLELQTLPVVRPDVSVQDVVHAFRNRDTDMVLVTERGTIHGEPLGVVTARDVLGVLIGDRKIGPLV